jgi:hypothetical protein
MSEAGVGFSSVCDKKISIIQTVINPSKKGFGVGFSSSHLHLDTIIILQRAIEMKVSCTA